MKKEPYLSTIPISEQPDFDFVNFIIDDTTQEIRDCFRLSYFESRKSLDESTLDENTLDELLKCDENTLKKIEIGDITLENAEFHISLEDKLNIEYLQAKKNFLNLAIKYCKETTSKEKYTKASITIQQILNVGVQVVKAEMLEKAKFTNRELIILYLREKLYSPNDITRLLCISMSTLRTHLKNIANKIQNTENAERYQKSDSNNARNPMSVIDDFIQYGWIDNESYYKYRQNLMM